MDLAGEEQKSTVERHRWSPQWLNSITYIKGIRDQLKSTSWWGTRRRPGFCPCSMTSCKTQSDPQLIRRNLKLGERPASKTEWLGNRQQINEFGPFLHRVHVMSSCAVFSSILLGGLRRITPTGVSDVFSCRSVWGSWKLYPRWAGPSSEVKATVWIHFTV